MSEASGTTNQVKTVYTTCWCNCGGNFQCIIKAHVKDNKVIAVEPDDRYNTNVGREDATLTEKDLIKTHLQRRPCVMGLAFHKYLYHPDRILYPLKREPGSKRGEGKFVRISWDEALTTVADKMKETREKYGPYSIMTPYSPNATVERIFSFWGAGVDGWGWCSYDAARLMAHVVGGERGWDMTKYSSGSAPDMLAHSKMIVLWGCDPTVGHQGPAHMFAWYIKLARERGIPVIIIDPRYSTAAHTLADQWIPIKPGTDRAMYMAIAYVLFEKELWNKNFVEKYIEPVGFEKWRNYVLGQDDGVAKTPEWAEKKCGIPAETIRDLAIKIGTVKPAWLAAHWSASRKGDGEQTVGAFAALQGMMGYWGTPGAGPSIHIGPQRPVPVGVYANSWGPQGEYHVPKLYRSHYWAEAVLLLDKVRSGELSEEKYMSMVGWKDDPSYIKEFNPKFLFWGGGILHAANFLATACNSSGNQIKALNRMDFFVYAHSVMNATAKYADIIFPIRDPMWEEKCLSRSAAYGAFECINYAPEVVSPMGEVKSWVWVYVKLAEKLGVDPVKFFPRYTSDENWEKDWEQYQKDTYENVVEYYKKKGVSVPPWEEFSKGKFLNLDELDEEPFTGWDAQIKRGEPFNTQSGKIELYSHYIANEENRGKGEHFDHKGRPYDNLPADWTEMTPYPTYKALTRGLDDPMTEKYPLILLTPHSRYRVHSLFWEHDWLRNHVYRHRVWINAADAKARGIQDNEPVLVYNDRGKALIPAYVTSRVMPGIVVIHAGARPVFNEEGIDTSAAPSTLLGGDFTSCHAPARATNLVQIEKCGGTH